MAFHEHFLKNFQLALAVERNDAAAVERLLSFGANPNAFSKDGKGSSLLCNAAYRNNAEMITHLLKAGADPKIRNHRYETPFYVAWFYDRIDAFMALQKGCELKMTIDDQGLTLSGPAYSECLFPVDLTHAKIILKNGASFGRDSRKIGSYLLQQALVTDDRDALDLLISKGADINYPSGDKRSTALHTAISHRRYEAVKLLLEKGANLAAKDGQGLIPAELAKIKGNPAIMALLKCAPEPPAQPAAAPEGWILLAPDRVAHVTSEPALGRKITDIFNFAKAERTCLIENTRTGSETAVLKSFAEMADKSPAERALVELQRLGGAADPSVIYAPPRNKQPLMPDRK